MQREQLLLELDEAGQTDCWHIEYIERTIEPEIYILQAMQCYGNQSNVVKTSHKKGFGSEHQNTNQFDFFSRIDKTFIHKMQTSH